MNAWLIEHAPNTEGYQRWHVFMEWGGDAIDKFVEFYSDAYGKVELVSTHRTAIERGNFLVRTAQGKQLIFDVTKVEIEEGTIL